MKKVQENLGGLNKYETIRKVLIKAVYESLEMIHLKQHGDLYSAFFELVIIMSGFSHYMKTDSTIGLGLFEKRMFLLEFLMHVQVRP